MSFLEILIENNAPSEEVMVCGVGGDFSFKFNRNVRILKVYHLIGREQIRGVKSFRYSKETGRLNIKTMLSYFGNVKFIIKYVDL